MRIRLVLLLIAFPALCSGTAPDGPIPLDAKRTIDDANAAWVPGLMAEDLDRACVPFEPDTLFVGDDGSTTRGLADFKAGLQKRFAQGWRVTGGRVTQGGAHMVNGKIVEWGESLLKTVDSHGVAHDGGGYYLAVWERDAKGTWKISRNIGLGMIRNPSATVLKPVPADRAQRSQE